MFVGPAIALLGISSAVPPKDNEWSFFQAYSWLSTPSSPTEVSSTYHVGLAVSMIGLCLLVGGLVGIVHAFTRSSLFWMGVGVLIGGVILFGYGSLTITSLFEQMRGMFTPQSITDWAVDQGMLTVSPVQILEEQLFLVQLLQLMGLGMTIVGAIMLAYGLWVKKENR